MHPSPCDAAIVEMIIRANAPNEDTYDLRFVDKKDGVRATLNWLFKDGSPPLTSESYGMVIAGEQPMEED